MGLLCKLFGHKFVAVGENLGIASAHDCTRCGHHSPVIDWNAIARPLGAPVTHQTIWSPAGPRIGTHAPAPPMPECKTPRMTEGEWQAAMLTEAKRTNELLQQVVEQGARNEFIARVIHE